MSVTGVTRLDVTRNVKLIKLERLQSNPTVSCSGSRCTQTLMEVNYFRYNLEGRH